MRRLYGRVIAKSEASTRPFDQDGLVRLTIRVPKAFVSPDGAPFEGEFRFGDGLGIPERYSADYIGSFLPHLAGVEEGDEELFYDPHSGVALVGLDVATLELLEMLVENTQTYLEMQLDPDKQLEKNLHHLKACLASEELTKELIAKYNVHTLLSECFSGILTPQEVADAQAESGLHSNRNKTYTVVGNKENADHYDVTIDVAASGRWVEQDMFGEEPPVNKQRPGIAALGLRELEVGDIAVVNEGVKRKKEANDPPLFEAVDDNLPLVLITQGGACGMMLQALREREKMENPAPISLYVAVKRVIDLPDEEELLRFLSKGVLKSLELAVSAPMEMDLVANERLMNAGVVLHLGHRLPVDGMAEDVQGHIGATGKVILSGIKPFVFGVKDALGVPEDQIQFTKAPDRANEQAPIQGVKPSSEQVSAASKGEGWVEF